MAGILRSHSVGSTMVLTLSQPEQGNALTPAMCAAGVEAINAADSIPEVRCVIITGEGAHFCGRPPSASGAANPSDTHGADTELSEALEGWVHDLRSFSKPVIAAVEGRCQDTGLALMLGCDLVVAARHSLFQLQGADWGTLPAAGVSSTLLHRLPHALAMQMLMLGQALDAATLQHWGLVNAVSEAGAALSQALAWADALQPKSPQVLASLKELAIDVSEMPLSTCLKQDKARHLQLCVAPAAHLIHRSHT